MNKGEIDKGPIGQMLETHFSGGPLGRVREPDPELEDAGRRERLLAEMFDDPVAMYSAGGAVHRMLESLASSPEQRRALSWLRRINSALVSPLMSIVAEFAEQTYVDMTGDTMTNPIEHELQMLLEAEGWPDA